MVATYQDKVTIDSETNDKRLKSGYKQIEKRSPQSPSARSSNWYRNIFSRGD